MNRNLARFEQLKKVILIAEVLSAESRTLAASMKLRRRAVEEKFREEIEKMCAEAEASRVVSKWD